MNFFDPKKLNDEELYAKVSRYVVERDSVLLLSALFSGLAILAAREAYVQNWDIAPSILIYIMAVLMFSWVSIVDIFLEFFRRVSEGELKNLSLNSFPKSKVGNQGGYRTTTVKLIVIVTGLCIATMYFLRSHYR